MNMEWIMGHGVSVGVAIFLAAMVLYGHYRGFLKTALTMSALILSLTVVHVAMPYAAGFVRENTALHQVMQGALSRAAGIEEEESDPEIPAQQRELIEKLHLPEQMKEALLENNNSEIYHILGVDTFLDYVGSYLADMVINLIGAVVLFVGSYLLIRLLIRWLDLFTSLPIVSGVNQIAGALLGGIQGLFWVWAACIILDACAGTDWAQTVLAQVRSSAWLSFLHNNNLISWLVAGVLRSFL